MKFRPGQEVICIDGGDVAGLSNPLERGGAYRVADIWLGDNHCIECFSRVQMTLEGVPDRVFSPCMFRPAAAAARAPGGVAMLRRFLRDAGVGVKPRERVR